MSRGLGGIAAAAALALAGCSAKGVLLVRGVVRAEGPRGGEPHAGATVQCREGRTGPARYARVTTADDGAYRIEYRYEGSHVPVLGSPADEAWLEFAAPGYRTRVVRARSGREPGVSRGESGPWLRLDVTLAPERAAPAPAGR
jgi:hypothetical protein